MTSALSGSSGRPRLAPSVASCTGDALCRIKILRGAILGFLAQGGALLLGKRLELGDHLGLLRRRQQLAVRLLGDAVEIDGGGLDPQVRLFGLGDLGCRRRNGHRRCRAGGGRLRRRNGHLLDQHGRPCHACRRLRIAGCERDRPARGRIGRRRGSVPTAGEFAHRLRTAGGRKPQSNDRRCRHQAPRKRPRWRVLVPPIRRIPGEQLVTQGGGIP